MTFALFSSLLAYAIHLLHEVLEPTGILGVVADNDMVERIVAGLQLPRSFLDHPDLFLQLPHTIHQLFSLIILFLSTSILVPKRLKLLEECSGAVSFGPYAMHVVG